VNEEWLVVPNLWGAVIAKAGMTKSDAAGDALRFISRMDRDLMHDFNRHIAQWQELNNQIKAETDNTKREQMKAARGPKPVRRQYTVDDITTQMLGEVLEQNPAGVLLRNDELGQWLLSFLRKGNEADRKFYLKCWSGLEDAKIQRIGRGFHYVPGACVSIFGTIQPGVIAQYINAATANGEEADGLVQRLQLMVFPDTKPDFNLVDNNLDPLSESRVRNIFESFPFYDFGYNGLISDLPYIRFTPDAQRFFEHWLVEHQRRLRSSDLHSAVTAHLNKFNSLVPALALIFHCVEMVHSNSKGPVSLAAAELALRWVQYLESHAMRIYSNITDEEDRDRLIKMIEAGKFKGQFTARDVIHQRQPGLTKAKRVTEILLDLADEGMLQVDKFSGIAPRFTRLVQR
jgi:putative DNA primase/helicase